MPCGLRRIRALHGGLGAGRGLKENRRTVAYNQPHNIQNRRSENRRGRGGQGARQTPQGNEVRPEIARPVNPLALPDGALRRNRRNPHGFGKRRNGHRICNCAEIQGQPSCVQGQQGIFGAQTAGGNFVVRGFDAQRSRGQARRRQAQGFLPEKGLLARKGQFFRRAQRRAGQGRGNFRHRRGRGHRNPEHPLYGRPERRKGIRVLRQNRALYVRKGQPRRARSSSSRR